MSVVVIGLNHRTVPLDLLERMTVDGAAPAQGAARPRRPRPRLRGRRALDLQPHRGLRRRRAVPRRLRTTSATSSPSWPSCRPRTSPTTSTSTTTTRPSATSSRSPPGSTPPCSARARSSARSRDGVGAWPGTRAPPARRSTCCSATPSRSASGPAPRPASAAASTSVSQAAVAMAAERLGALDGRRVLVLGAGEMGEGMAVALAGAGRRRGARRQPHLATGPRRWPTGSAAGPSRLADLADAPGRGRPAAHLHRRHVDHPRARRPRAGRRAPRAGRPLLIVDIAVPRDVDPAAGDLPGVTLLDMDDLRRFAEAGVAERRREVAAVAAHRRRRGRPLRDERHRPRGRPARRRPARAGRRASARPSSTASAGRLADLDAAQREAVEAAHPGPRWPSCCTSRPCGSRTPPAPPKGERLAEALRDLFDL